MEDSDQDFFPCEIDACFQIPESSDLLLDSEIHGSSTLEHLSYCVVRNPSDLISHMRRIVLQEKLGDSETLYAALVDLFIALGSKGKALRSRLLRQYRARLSDSQYGALLQGLKPGAANDRSLYSDASVLARGITGTCSLVLAIDDPVAPMDLRDPLEEARDCLEYSQIDEARKVLERAVLEYPDRLEIQTELLELYRAGRDVENFTRIYRELKRSGKALSDAWASASEFFSEHA